jgi:signal transduction histidine kinase
MKFSIRTQLTLLVMGIFLFIFFFLIFSAGVTLYLTLLHTVDRNLEIEEKRLAEMVTSEFHELSTANAEKLQSLSEDFIEELNEIYLYEHQFVMISLKSSDGRHVYTGGEREYVQRLLLDGFSSQVDGFFNWKTDEKHYRILIRHKNWGWLVIGAENQTFFSMIKQFRNIFLIGIPFLLLLVFIAGNFLARRVMRPVVHAAQKAEHITLADLGNKLSEYDHADEFGILTNTLNELLTRVNLGIEQIRRFTQDAAHELRTPITILRGELELLYQHQGRITENHAALQKALDKTILLNQIVDDLMLLAHSDSSNYLLNPTTFPLEQILRDTVEDLEILSRKSPVKIQLMHCDPVQFSGDEALIRRLLLNLADNALKYTEKGLITFSLKDLPDAVQIQICDTGIGIPEQDIPHIFDRFHRVNRARSNTKNGSGLGMSISKWIVEAHGGQIRIESKLSVGTKISIRFPKNIS